MGGYWTLAQWGSVSVSHFRYALSRHSRSHSGSSFLAEIARTTSSLKPGRNASDSIGDTKPYAYSRLTRVSTDESILPPPTAKITPESGGYQNPNCRFPSRDCQSIDDPRHREPNLHTGNNLGPSGAGAALRHEG